MPFGRLQILSCARPAVAASTSSRARTNACAAGCSSAGIPAIGPRSQASVVGVAMSLFYTARETRRKSAPVKLRSRRESDGTGRGVREGLEAHGISIDELHEHDAGGGAEGPRNERKFHEA